VETDAAVEPAAGPFYAWRGPCRVPACELAATDGHHVVPRGRLGGPALWIAVDGVVAPNVAGVCRFHHELVTERPELIRWDGERWRWEPSGEPLRPLAGAEAAAGTRCCPACGQRLPRPNPYGDRRARLAAGKAPRAPRRRWSIAVPAEAAEDGTEVLDTLVAEVAELMGMPEPDAGSARYYALAAALAAAVQG
jgi:hypothetical protein